MIIGPLRTPTIKTSAQDTFTVYGKSFFNIQGVYLSGYPYENVTLYNPFSGVQTLSGNNPEFFGVKLSASEYQYNNVNTLTFQMPSATRPGFVDIIIENEAGWGTLTKYSLKYTINPYPSGHPMRDQWEPYQRPWRNGIQVLG